MANRTSVKADPRGQGAGIAAQTLASHRILVAKNADERLIKAKDDKPERTIYTQAAMIVGGTRAIMWSITAFEQSDVYKEGVYMLSRDGLRLNGKFDDLEINPYERLVFIRDMTEAEMLSLYGSPTSLSDLT